MARRTSLSQPRQLPPLPAIFLVYQRVVIDGSSTRLVAEEANVSQTRVRQIVLRVTQWLVETLPADTDLSEAAQLRLGRHIAAGRLGTLWRSQPRPFANDATKIRQACCLRIIAAQSKVPALPGALEALAMDAILSPLTMPGPKSQVQSPKSDLQTNFGLTAFNFGHWTSDFGPSSPGQGLLTFFLPSDTAQTQKLLTLQP